MQTLDQVSAAMTTSAGQGAVGSTPVFVQITPGGSEIEITQIFYEPGEVLVSPSLVPGTKRVVIRTY